MCRRAASQVNPPGVYEHGTEERQEITRGIGKEAAGDKGTLLNKSVAAAQFWEEEQDVQND